MGLSAEIALAVAKKYTDNSLEGGGSVRGKNCTISSITPITGGNRVTFAWELDDGTAETETMDVMDGSDGRDGSDGATGATGPAGNGIASVSKTGTSGLVDTYTITFTNGNTSTFTVTNGSDGSDGATGATGNGISNVAKTGTSGLVDTYTITFTNGTTTTFTVTNGAAGSDGVGVPTGGTTGQVLSKRSNTNYDTVWITPSGGGGGDPYEALIDVDIMEDFSKYSSADAANVKDFGAVGDGVTPDNAAFTSAIATGKPYILIPHGTYDLNHVEITIPAGVSLIGENENDTVLLNNHWTAQRGFTVKNLTFDGGSDVTIDGSWAHYSGNVFKIIIFSRPLQDCSVIMDRCIFKNAHYANWAGYRVNYDGSTSFRFDKVSVTNCVFEDFDLGGLYHELEISYAEYSNNIFRNMGYITADGGYVTPASDIEFVEVANPVGNPVENGYYERSGTAPNYTYTKSADTSVVVAHEPYFVRNGHNTVMLLIGDSSNHSENMAEILHISNNTFEDIISNTYSDAPKHSDEANFVKIGANVATVDNNVFKNLTGYAHDREGVYVKANYGEIAYNYIENGGLGEGYICCKKPNTPASDRVVNVHNNTLIGNSGGGIRCYMNSTVTDNTIVIANAKFGIWADGEDSNTILENNYLKVNFDIFTLSDGVSPDDYHGKRYAIENSTTSEMVSIKNNIVLVSVSAELNATLSASNTYGVIRIQSIKSRAIISGNIIITNALYGTGNTRYMRGIFVYNATSATANENPQIDVNDNDVSCLYIPIDINVSGITGGSSIVNVKNNLVRDPSHVRDNGNRGYALRFADNGKTSTLTYETTQKTAGFKTAHIYTNCDNIDVYDSSVIARASGNL